MGVCFAAESIDEMVPPIAGLRLNELRDVFADIHHGHVHHAIDIMEARGTPIHAVVSGTIRKLQFSKAGGKTIYQIDERGAYYYYYAHLDRYAAHLRDGDHVESGDIIGYVGSTGNASARAPHLHFAVSKVISEKQWWRGIAVNPYEALLESVRRGHGPLAPARKDGTNGE
jgi:murein DD-endopeptidase MepM/ murein hydrolase activator NlpD